MKDLVTYYLNEQNYAGKRTWSDWPFHNFYNYRENENGGVKCVDKWKDVINSNMAIILAKTDFNDLYSLLKEWSKDVPGIGSLHVYDTATCFAQPKEVHLNCGAMEAAKAINPRAIKKGVAPYESLKGYDEELGRLTPLQLEDFLCINKKVFQNIMTPKDQLRKHIELNQKRSSCAGVTPKSSNKCRR